MPEKSRHYRRQRPEGKVIMRPKRIRRANGAPRRRQRWGARTFGMLVCAYVWALLGIGAFFETSVRHPGIFHLVIPGSVRGTIWLFSALIAVIFAWSRRYSSIAIGILWFMPALQMVSYGYSWFLYLVPGGNPGYSAGWYASSLYAALIGIVVLCALIPSPPVKHVAIVEDEER